MARHGRTAAGVAAGTALLALVFMPGSVAAGTGALDLRYTTTSTNWNEVPSRKDQSTYSPCSGIERLAGIGAWVIESAPTFPNVSSFQLGKAYNVSIRPVNQAAGAPNPDSNHQVADNLFTVDNDLVLGESTVCASAGIEPTYERSKRESPGGKRTELKARCGGGSQVLSGGGAASGPFRSQRLVASAPYDSGDPGNVPDDGWRVAVDNLRNRDRSAQAFAICGEVDDPTYESTTFDAGTRERRHVALACPVNEFALGGGLTHDVPNGKATLVASRHFSSPYRGWRIELDNLSHQNEAQGRAFVICHA